LGRLEAFTEEVNMKTIILCVLLAIGLVLGGSSKSILAQQRISVSQAQPRINQPTPRGDDVLSLPSIPDVIRKKCQTAHPEEISQLDAEEKELANVRGQADYFRREAETARLHAIDYRKLAQDEADIARRWDRQGEKAKAEESRRMAERYAADAVARDAEAKSDTQKAEEFERQAREREARVRGLRLKVLEDCSKLVLALPAPAQKPKDSKSPLNVQKNTDGTTTYTYAEGNGTRAETFNSKGRVVDFVYTEPSADYGDGGTKVTIITPQSNQIVAYKDKAGKVRHIDQTNMDKNGNKKQISFDFYGDGSVKAHASFVNNKLISKEQFEYDKLGRRLRMSLEYFNALDHFVQVRVNYKYADNNDKQGTLTTEIYDETTGKWETTTTTIFQKGIDVEGKPDEIRAAIRGATERQGSNVEDLTSPDAPDTEVPKSKEEPPKKDASTSPSTTKDAKPRVATGQKGAIDPCLVGTWRSESIVNIVGYRGGSGIVMTIKGDGSITIDYNQMESLEAEVGTKDSRNVWKGTATGHITTSNGIATIISVDTSEVIREYTYPYTDAQGRTTTRTTSNALSKLGPAAPGMNPIDNSYKCDETTLTRKSPSQTFTFKRETKEPK
jgi:hypothetical protein